MLKRFAFVGLMASSLVLNTLAGDLSTDLAIIVSKNSPLESVTSAELAKILKAEKSKGPDGAKFVLLTREVGSPERAVALAGIYGMTDGEYNKFFLQATFTGAVAAAPKQIGSAASMKQFVAGTPGAVGYIRGNELDASVKAVKIDGKAPGEEGYKLTIPTK